MNFMVFLGLSLLLFGILMAKWTAFTLVISIVGCMVMFGGFLLDERPKNKKAIPSQWLYVKR